MRKVYSSLWMVVMILRVVVAFACRYVGLFLICEMVGFDADDWMVVTKSCVSLWWAWLINSYVWNWWMIRVLAIVGRFLLKIGGRQGN